MPFVSASLFSGYRGFCFFCLIGIGLLGAWPSPAIAASGGTLIISSICEGDRSVSATLNADSAIVDDPTQSQNARQVIHFGTDKQSTADTLFALMRGLGGSLVLRCPNVESVSCRFEAVLADNKVECTNCSACSDDLDRMSLATLHRLKALLRGLNLYL